MMMINTIYFEVANTLLLLLEQLGASYTQGKKNSTHQHCFDCFQEFVQLFLLPFYFEEFAKIFVFFL